MHNETRDTGWFRSSYSTSGSATCVEVRIVAGSRVGVRDSTNRDAGALWVHPDAWASFVHRVRSGVLDSAG